MAMTLPGYPSPARCLVADRPVNHAGDVVSTLDVATCGVTFVPIGGRPDPLRERARSAAGIAMRVAPRHDHLVRPSRGNQRRVLETAAISERRREIKLTARSGVRHG